MGPEHPDDEYRKHYHGRHAPVQYLTEFEPRDVERPEHSGCKDPRADQSGRHDDRGAGNGVVSPPKIGDHQCNDCKVEANGPIRRKRNF
jgi:hypothetical protein